ncbi:MAG: asparagine synthase (glutamine-hydrolyzing) [Candidatus Omnitrophica bacterium]|nr:Asparagine synthetase [glutamine-hydrolyzing] 1 [bacterium]NUN97100.1 asparagine synthase (glutamine-hydrolyzing) [Candidatus Omnitrophota bacterium]
MCGIFGLFLSERTPIPDSVAEAASTAMFPRGPDALGVWSRPGALLGMRRLAIIDPEGPSPPLTNESGRWVAVGNGEIYNHAEIRKRLLQAGHSFRSGNDLEVLAHLPESGEWEWELGLRGMFAFAVWDSHTSRLHLARDRFGIKPLFWCGDETGIAFASALPALREMLLAWGKSRAEQGSSPWRGLLAPEGWSLDQRGLRWYLDTLCVPAPETFFRHVQALPPATRLLWEPGSPPRLETYWTPRYLPKRKISLKQAQDEFEECFPESVRYHLVSDVPVGAFLSGGLDSSYLVAEAAEQLGNRLSTFTVGFRECDYSELDAARELARNLGTDHHEILLGPLSSEDLPSIIRAMNQPFADSSAWPTWAISRAVGKSLKVALSGDGGDELWGGYPYYPISRLSRWLPKREWNEREPFATSILSRSGRVLRDCLRPARALHSRWRHLDPNGRFWDSLLLPEHRLGPFEIPFPNETEGSDHEKLLAADVAFYLPHDLLEKVDTMSMAHSLEVRVPWLDPILFERIAHFPPSLKISGGITKWLVRRSIARRAPNPFPPSLLQRDKHGFAIPVHRWMARDLAERFREGPLAEGSRVSAIFAPRELRRVFEAHRAGRIRVGHHLWAVLVLDLWLRENRLAL